MPDSYSRLHPYASEVVSHTTRNLKSTSQPCSGTLLLTTARKENPHCAHSFFPSFKSSPDRSCLTLCERDRHPFSIWDGKTEGTVGAFPIRGSSLLVFRWPLLEWSPGEIVPLGILSGVKRAAKLNNLPLFQIKRIYDYLSRF